jgi:hypothetical protein
MSSELEERPTPALGRLSVVPHWDPGHLVDQVLQAGRRISQHLFVLLDGAAE